MSFIILGGFPVYRGGSRRNDSIGIPRLQRVSPADGIRLMGLSLRLINPIELRGIWYALVKPNTLYKLGGSW